MQKIALTGSALSGKKTVCKLFRSMGIPIFDADLATKFLIHYDTNTINKIKKKFGSKAYEIGFLNPKFFNNDLKMNELLLMVTDDIQRLFLSFCDKHKNGKNKYVIFKCSYFYEMKMNDWYINYIGEPKPPFRVILDNQVAQLAKSNNKVYGPDFDGCDYGMCPAPKLEITKKSFFNGIINVYSPIDIRKFRRMKSKIDKSFDSEFDPISKKRLSTYNIESYDNIDILSEVERVHYSILNTCK